MALAFAQAQPQVAKKAPEHSSSRPVAHHPFESPFSASTDYGTILYLQRTAGNAAVASLIEAQRRPLHVQRCAGRACGCSPGERLEHEDESGSGETAVPIQRFAMASSGGALPVQRGFFDALTGAATSLLPEPIKAVLTGSAAHANAEAHELKEKGSQMPETAHAHGGQILEGSSTEAETTAKKTEGEMRTHADEAHASSGKAVVSGDAATSEGQAAAGNLQSMGTYAAAMMNPVGPIIELPGFRDGLNHVVSVLAAIPGGVADLTRDLGSAVTDGLKAGQSGGWNCDQAQIMAMASGVEKALATAGVNAGKKVLGAERYEALVGWAHERVGDLKALAATVRGYFEKAKEMLQHFWDITFVPLLKKLQGLMEDVRRLKDRLTKVIGEQFERVKKLAAAAWTAIQANVIEPVIARAHAAKEAVTRLVADARHAIGSWWDHLPDAAKGAIIGLGAVIAAPFALALTGAEKAKAALVSLAERLAKHLKTLADGVLQAIATKYQTIRKWATEAVAAFKKKWAAIRTKVHDYLSAAYGKVDGATGGFISRLMAGAADMKRKIAGEVCTALGDTAGPCVGQFVPNPGTGESADVTLNSNAAVTVPVYGVPVKVGEGAAVKLSREGHDSKKYTVTETGEGLIAVVAPKAGGEGPGKASVDIVGPMGTGFNAWQALTGSSTGAAAAGGAAGAAGGAGAAPEQKVGPEVEAEAGYKGSVDMTYAFDASKGKDSTCDGLGGLTALLSAQGLSYAMPPPFSALGAVVAGSFGENVTSCVVTLAQYGNASVNVKQDGLAGLEAAIKGESSVAMERTKKEGEGWIDTASLKQSLGVSGAAKLATGGDLPLNLSTEAGATGTAFVKLEYSEAKDKVSALAAGAKLALSLDIDPGKIQAVLPASVAAPVLAQVTPYLRSPKSGSLEIEASYAVTNLQDLLSSLDTYFNETPPEKVDTNGLFKTLADYMANAKIEQELTVKLKTTRTIAKGVADIDAKEAGVTGGFAIEEHRSTTIYAYPAGAGAGD
jgi:hypothetical protein